MVMPRRPSPPIPIRNGLWSLWDMLDRWGYLYFAAANALTYAETALEQQRTRTGGVIAGHGTSILDPHGLEADLVENQCRSVMQLMLDHREELGPIPFNLGVLTSKLVNSRKPHHLELYTNDILDDVRRILNDFRAILSTHKFYYLPQSLSRFYGDPLLFGEAVAKKFPAASNDIERAGNCLALGEPTACVMHLNRAMEIAVRRLAKKLHVTVNAKDNMGGVLGNMTEPIKQMPDKTEAQKRKKELWAECRTNLYHVKMAWRDPAHHGKQDYTEKQAHDIMGRVRDFMQQLATLL
jgi:hypothetical protein